MRLAAHNIVIATALAARAKRRRLDMSNTHRITTTAAVLLSLATAGAPAASARPADYVPAGHQAPAGIYSRPDKSTIPASPPATSGGAIGRPALLRSLAQQERQRVAALSAYREGELAATFDGAAAAANKSSAPQAVVRVHAPQSGFDWGDAGLGAAGALALLVIAVGGAFVVSQRRSRRSTAVPS